MAEMVQEFQALGKPCSGLFIDGGGMGSGPIDRLRQMGYNPIEVQFGKTASDRRYRFVVDEIWGRLRDALGYLCLPRDDKLRAEMIQREYGFTPSGLINLESKRAIKDRGGISPDVTDALALTYGAVMAVDMPVGPQQYVYDYDPLEGAA